ncbi:MAG: hypothetical protein AABM43_06845 [Actinomycetota bacterium]
MAEPAKQMAPDEAAFLEDLAGARFLAGDDAGRWRLVGGVDWPFATIAVSAAPREGSPSEFAIRFELSGYPGSATGTPWHLTEGRALSAEERPKGGRAGLAFRPDWSNGLALYIPCDRVAVQGHGDWPTKHPGLLWDPAVGITSYLRVVHEVLHEDDYAGV